MLNPEASVNDIAGKRQLCLVRFYENEHVLRYGNVNGCEGISRFVVFLETGESAFNKFGYPQDVRGNNCSIYGSLAGAAEYANSDILSVTELRVEFRLSSQKLQFFNVLGNRCARD